MLSYYLLLIQETYHNIKTLIKIMHPFSVVLLSIYYMIKEITLSEICTILQIIRKPNPITALQFIQNNSCYKNLLFNSMDTMLSSRLLICVI